MSRGPTPDRRRVRARLAIGTSLSALGVAALVAVAATVLASWQSDDPSPETQAGAARVGDEVTVVIVAEDAADEAAAARADTLRWMLVALGVALVPAAVVGWFASGRLLGAVDRALADVEVADADRRRALQELAHELRTPLSVVGVNLELAAARADDPELASYVDAARRATSRMGATVADLGGHGRLAAAPERGPVDLGGVARSVTAEHEGPARRRQVRIETAGSPRLVVPSAHQASVHTVLANLVDNALRVAPPGSAVTLDWGADAGWAWVAVTDGGPGLAPRNHAKVFERGWRAPDTRHSLPTRLATRVGSGRVGSAHTEPGRGLGLAIARQLAEADGGVVTLDSDEGRGAVFALWLPAAGPGPAPPRSAVVDADGVTPRRHPWRPDGPPDPPPSAPASASGAANSTA